MEKIMKKAVCFKVYALSALLLPALIFSGCALFQPDNNYRHPADFVRHLNDCGIKVDAVRPLDPAPVAAGDALELIIGKSSIGVYKYDINNSGQRSRLEKIRRNKRVFFNGIPYPIYETSGSFVVIGLDKHKDKQRILEALRDFR